MTLPFAWNIVSIEQCASTNSELLKQVQNGSSGPGRVLVTTNQIAGRGRLNREWVAPPGSLTFSIALPNPFAADKLPQLNLVTGVALREAMASLLPNFDKSFQIKWPNDLYLNNLKVAGILSEAAPTQSIAVIGIGINLNSQLKDFPDDLSSRLTTVREFTRAELDPSICLNRVLEYLAAEWTRFAAGGLAALLEKLNANLAWKNAAVRIEESGSPAFTGKLCDVDLNGFLRVETTPGIFRHVIAGDVIRTAAS